MRQRQRIGPRLAWLLTSTLRLLGWPPSPFRGTSATPARAGRVLAVLLAIGLVAPPSVSQSSSAWAQEESVPEVHNTTAPEDIAPYWKLLRANIQDEGVDAVAPWTTDDLNAVHFPTDDVGYAVGGGADDTGPYGVVLRTQDRGDTWEEWRLRRAELIVDLHGVHFFNEQAGFAVGRGNNEEGSSAGVIVATRDGGERWALVDPEVQAALRDVHFPTPEIGYAVGDSGTILKTLDGGRSWERQAAPTTVPLYSVDFADELRGVAVGGNTASPRILVTSDGGSDWAAATTSGNVRPLRGVVLLEGSGVGYAVGSGWAGGSIDSSPLTVLRTTDAFHSQAGALDSEAGAGALDAVTAYWRQSITPIDAMIGLLEELLEHGPPDVREPMADAIHELAAAIAEHDDPTDEGVLAILAETFRAVADALTEPDNPWDEAAALLDQLREEIDGLLQETEDLRQEAAAILDGVAATLEEQQGATGDEDVDEPVDQELEDLGRALRDLASTIRESEEEEIVHDMLDEGRRQQARLEVAHSVGFHQPLGLPVAMTRQAGAASGEEASAGPRPWMAEPIEEWEEHQGVRLRGVSASPGGKTVVAVGTGGLMLRRAFAPSEVVESMCIPRDIAEPTDDLLAEAACPEMVDNPTQPEEKEPVPIPPPRIVLSPDAGRAGSAITVSGENWLTCTAPEDPEEAQACERSTVDLEFQQGEGRSHLRRVTAGSDGTFTVGVTVPSHASEGAAVMRAAGDPQPDGGPDAQVPFTVLSITPVSITPSPTGALPGETFNLSGAGWQVCEGLECEGTKVSLEFIQGDLKVELGSVTASSDGGFTGFAAVVPEAATEGKATLRAKGSPRPDGGSRADAVFDVHTECRISVEATNPDLPCLTAFTFKDKSGAPTGLPSVLRFDPNLGGSGRVVGVLNSQVFLYDISDVYVETHWVANDLTKARVGINDQVFDQVEPGDELSKGITVEDLLRRRDDNGVLQPCVRFSLENNDLFDVCPGERLQKGLQQRGVRGFAEHFANTESRDGDRTGVVDLYDAEGIPAPSENRIFVGEHSQRVALDTVNQRLYLATLGSQAVPQVITAMSLVGEFPPTRHVVDLGPREIITHLTVDENNSMLYLATTAPGGAHAFSTTVLQRDVFVRAIRAHVVRSGKDRQLVLGEEDAEGPFPEAGIEPVCVGEEDAEGLLPEVERRVAPSWSLYVGDLCSTTAHNGLRFFGVSQDGRRLSLPCQGTDFFWMGFPQANPNGILVVSLPGKVSPRDLTQADASPLGGAIGRRFQAVPGGGMGSNNVQRIQGDQAAGLMVWRSGQRVLVWDVDRAGWVGEATFEGQPGNPGANLLAIDPAVRRLYLIGSVDIPDDHVAQMEVLNLPGVVERAGFDSEGNPLSLKTGTGLARSAPVAAVDPESRRFLIQAGGLARVLEDKTPPPISRVDLDPDRLTNDLDEQKAFSVSRRGEVAAYGARVWWTGLNNSLPGTYAVDHGGGLSVLGEQDPPPGLTYDDLMNRHLDGIGARRVPWQPHRGQREVFSARVQEGVLESDDSPDFSSGSSGAIAWGIDIDGRPDDDQGAGGEGTGEDARGRRSVGDWRREVTAEFERRCSLRPECRDWWAGSPDSDEEDQSPQEQWEEHAGQFDSCSEEFHDRLLRELDGERRVEPEDPCFSFFDEHDPGWNDETEQNERPGLEQRLGWTQRSRCVDNIRQPDTSSTTGSTVVCDLDSQTTLAAADNALSLELPGGVTLDIDGSFSGTRIFRHPERGLLSEALSVASGFELAMQGVGRFQIGEVLTTAQSWANGRPDGARSVYSVTYKDVRVISSGPSDEDGGPGDVVVFSCDPQEDQAVVAGEELPAATCDPETLADALASVFGPRVSITAPDRDLDKLATGTPRGAQAIVRRDRVDYFNDRIVLQMDREELPGLQIEINADGTLANRYRIDLAAVYAEATYFIGDLAPPTVPPAMVEAPMIDHRQTATVEVELLNPEGERLEGGTFELVQGAGFSAGCTTNTAGECVVTALPLGDYTLRQLEAPPGYTAADPIGFALTEPGQVARITVVNGRGGRDGSEVIEIIEIIDDARLAAADDGTWWRRALRGLPSLILNPWAVLAIALLTSIVITPAYLANRRRELLTMREVT